jgi:putative PEP-CTERM system histidine kinase
MVFVEQVARNTRRDFMWGLKFMTLGLGTLFGYSFILHADTVLFSAVSAVLFIPQGFVFSLAVPMIAIASLRNPVNRLNFSVSREFAFRSGVLVLTGSYLIITGAAGFYVRLFGGEWGDVFFVLVLVVGILGLLILALSTRVQGALRIALKRNLYEYKYDYREEWLRVSAELTGPGREDSLEERAIHAVGELVQSTSGAVFRVTDQDVLVPTGQINAAWATPLSSSTTLELRRFFLRGEERIVDLDVYRDDPASFAGLDLAHDDAALASARFLVPLRVGDQLFGMLALGQPSVATTLDWEDRDTLKVIARQAAGFLALKNADAMLSASEQFRVRQELSAFVVHDLKTVSGQLTLMLRNAKRHRDNPAFLDDLLNTVENAVGRMDHLLAQLRDPGKTDVPLAETDVLGIIRSIIQERSSQLPIPTLLAETFTDAQGCVALVDPAPLRSAINHLVQNAQDATADDGQIELSVTTRDRWIHIEITDNGEGMTEAFLRERLFSPFNTSKGVAGVGIGAYQAREVIRSFGGDLSVSSRRGRGSTFTIRLPHIDSSTRQQQAS